MATKADSAVLGSSDLFPFLETRVEADACVIQQCSDTEGGLRTMTHVFLLPNVERNSTVVCTTTRRSLFSLIVSQFEIAQLTTLALVHWYLSIACTYWHGNAAFLKILLDRLLNHGLDLKLCA